MRQRGKGRSAFLARASSRAMTNQPTLQDWLPVDGHDRQQVLAYAQRETGL
jgi:hypothetical protein